ncbi:type II toxin-antitoxin system YhaV family toxin [Paramesorhizobium deserti]|uniref:type II toxin-antitoxin system YhaV family toxin n=1 Tax=Paramesorhizobium deserti TaxID=1494590 RepID=UPI0009E84F29
MTLFRYNGSLALSLTELPRRLPDIRSSMTSPRKPWYWPAGDTEVIGNGRFRLFFRYDTSAKIIIFAWVNDETTLRTYGAKTDAYKVFKGMLDDGNPPDDWAALHKAASESATVKRLESTTPANP